jgi:hypothetical protein
MYQLVDSPFQELCVKQIQADKPNLPPHLHRAGRRAEESFLSVFLEERVTHLIGMRAGKLLVKLF